MRFLKYPILLCAFLWCASFQSPEENPTDPIILKVGENTVTLSEFKFIYEKNNMNSDDAYSEKSIREYLDLFIKFKLKVNEAVAQNYHSSSDFQNEYAIYKKQLAKPYLTESKVTDALVKQAYERLKYEINASHILVRVPENASPADTLEAFKKMKEIRKKVTQGQDFDQLAKEFSEDPSAKENAGNLGWFTALQMVYQFEDKAYETAKKQTSPIFRTSYGYHILKTLDRRASNGAVKVAHLMIRTSKNPTSADIQEAKNKIVAIEQEIKKGKKWAEAVQQYSEDLATKERGGELDWFSAGTMIKAIEEASFDLKKSGDISKPVQSPYGFHLIRLVARKHLESFDKMEEILRQKVSRDSRSQLNRKLLIERLKKENQFAEIKNVKKLIEAKATDNLLSATWTYDPKADDLNTELFSIQTKKYTLENFLEFVRGAQQVQKSGLAKTYIKQLYTIFTKQKILEYEEAHLSDKYPEYRYLLNEYKEGILLFQIMEKNIWTKALTDESGLKKYFEENRQKYQQNPTAIGQIFDLADEATYQKLLKEFKKDFYPDNSAGKSVTGFALNSGILQSSEQESVNQIIVYLKNNPEAIVELQGSYTFEEKDNADIARQRIKIVKKYMTDKGIKTERIAEKNIGEAVIKGEQAGVKYLVYGKSLKLLQQNMNQENPLAIKITDGEFEDGKNALIDGIPAPKIGKHTLEQNGRFYYIVIDKIESARPKELKEVRGLVVSDYQSYLETKWIEDLRQKYAVEVFENHVQTLIKK